MSKVVLAPQDDFLARQISWGERVHTHPTVRRDLIGRAYRLEVKDGLRARIERTLAE